MCALTYVCLVHTSATHVNKPALGRVVLLSDDGDVALPLRILPCTRWANDHRPAPEGEV